MSMENVERKTRNQIQQRIDGFVDDTSLFTNLQWGNTNILELRRKAQHAAQLWEGLLSTTGSKLELQKYFYYILSLKWDKYKILYLKQFQNNKWNQWQYS
jgi:hypothetical protein